MKNGVVGADITDTATVHTARTGYRTAREIQLVADAMRNTALSRPIPPY